MALDFNDNLNIRSGKPIDSRFGPYLSISNVNSKIPRAQRYAGLIVGIYADPVNIVSSDVYLYYYYGDFSDTEIKRLGTKPIANSYANESLMFADQANQLEGYIFYDQDNGIYYEKLSTSNGNINDYRAIGGNNVIDILHSELLTLKNGNNLSDGALYRITDFQTVHRIINTSVINYGVIEPLIIRATGTNKLNTRVFSQDNPFDLIDYDVDSVLAEDNTTPRKGNIIYRKDTKLNISAYYDWRQVKYRRWKVLRTDKESDFVETTANNITLTLTFSPNLTTTYLNTYREWIISVPSTFTHAAGAVNLTVSKGTINLTRALYKKDGTTTWAANELANKKGYISYCIERNVYVLMDAVDIAAGMVNTYLSRASTLYAIGNNIRVVPDANDFIDYTTFNPTNLGNGSVRDVEIGRDSTNNVFRGNVIHVKIDGGSHHNTFNSNVQSFVMESEGLRNLFLGQVLWSYYATECWDNFYNNNIIYYKNYPYSVNTTYHLPSYNVDFSGGYIWNSTIISTGWGVYFKGTSIESSGIFTVGGNRSDFSITKRVQGSLIGYFNTDNITINKVLINKSIYVKPASNMLIDSLNLSAFATAVGGVLAIGVDENGNVVTGGTMGSNQTITLSGDVTGTGTNSITTTISDNAVTTLKIADKNVTYAKIQDVTADRMLGRLTTNGIVQELTATQIRTFLNVSDGANNYVHPTYTAINQTLSGATILASFVTDTIGSVTGFTTRTLTTADINAVNTNQLGVASGVATLDSGGKIPESQLPSSILGSVIYQDNWDASTNTPTLPDPTTVKGWYYIVSVGGTVTGTQYDGGSITFNPKDWVISNGIVWKKVDNTDLVTSVFGRLGNVVALGGDYESFYVRHDINTQGLTATNQGNARTNIDAEKTVIGAATTITQSNLTINRALISNASGKVEVSVVTSTELGYLSGVTSSIQTQLNSKIESITLSGDVTGSGTNSIATTISNNAVTTIKVLDKNITYAKIQDVTANTILGQTGVTGIVKELTPTQVRTIINVEDGANNYVHPTKTWVDKPVLVGASVIANLTINSLGHPTDWVTRNLTPADIGAATSSQINIATGQVAFGTAANTIGGSSNLTWDTIFSQTLKITSLSPQFEFERTGSVTGRTRFRSFARTIVIESHDGSSFLESYRFSNTAFGVLTDNPTNTLDVNGTTKIRTINNLGTTASRFLVANATGVVSERTGAQTLTDIGGIGGTIAAGQVAFGTAANTIGGDGGLTYSSGLLNINLATSHTGNGALNIVNHLNSNQRIRFGYDSTLNAGYIQATNSGVENRPLLLNPNAANVGIGLGGNLPTNTIDVNGTARIRTINNAIGNFVTTSATGVLQQRTAAETLTDIGGVPTTRTLAISTNNGVTGGLAAVDLSANRSWTIGLTGQALSLHNLGTNGIIVRTGAGTVASRSLVAGSNIVITNPDGVAGNPTISLAASTYSYDEDIFTYSGSTDFTLTVTQPFAVEVYLNGQRLVKTLDWTIAGNVVTVTTPLDTNNPDEIVVTYFYNTPDVALPGLTGSGTTNFVTKWGTSSSLTASTIFDDGINVGINTNLPTNTLDLNGSLRVRTINNAVGSFVTVNANGVLQKRTPTETRTDIGALGGNGTVNYISKFITTTTLGDSQIIDNGTNVLVGKTVDAGEKLQIEGNVLIKKLLLSNQENLDVDVIAPGVVAQVDITKYTSAFFDYSIKNGLNIRSGTVYASHDGTNVVFVETSTADLGDTSGVSLSVDIVTGMMRLVATVSSDNWIIKTLVRGL